MSHITNPLATVEQLYSRSTLNALPQDLQDVIFLSMQSLTQAAGLLLRLPQSVTAQANVVLARYWVTISWPFIDEFSDISAASLFLVAKLSSHPTTPRDLCNVYAYLLSPLSPLFRPSAADPPSTTPDKTLYYLSEPGYSEAHARILALESRVLCALSFDTHVALPHGLAVTYLKALDFLGVSPPAPLAQRVVGYLNTALLSPQLLYLTHQPSALAVAAIYNAAKDLGAKMPECAWWEVFDVDREELGFLVVGMRSVEGAVRAGREKDISAELHEGNMITRAGIETEMRKRGMVLGNGVNTSGSSENAAPLTEEDMLMRSLDERADQMDS
ncbi:cyclin domain-containing protein [Apiospora kogelbergensis]|uniref:cyclin domain-containing protein n=1 Tax=Apiospora kogelbergensis TaxID=1337665 RepID=UPI00312E0925